MGCRGPTDQWAQIGAEGNSGTELAGERSEIIQLWVKFERMLQDISRVPKVGILMFWALSCARSRCPLYTGSIPS